MLKLFFYQLKAKNICSLKKIKDIPKSCCKSSEIPVFDIDSLVQTFCKESKLQVFPSVDCIFLEKQENKQVYHFIEMKSWDNIKTHYPMGRCNDDNKCKLPNKRYCTDSNCLKDKLNSAVIDFFIDLESKFEGTLLSFHNLCFHSKLSFEKEKRNEIKIALNNNIADIILLTDNNGIGNTALTLQYLSLPKDVKDTLFTFNLSEQFQSHAKEITSFGIKKTPKLMDEKKFTETFILKKTC